MLKKNGSPIGAAIVFLVGLFAITTNDSAFAAGCLASPNRESGPGTHWHYRINQATKQRCWYLKRLGGASRTRPSGIARATPSSATRTATASRTTPAEVTPPAENESSIKAWFAATFSALSGSSTTSPSTEAREPNASEPAPARRRRGNSAERSEQSKAARAQERPSSAPAEAAGDKETAPAASDAQPEWQKALFEEFLQWRVKKLLFE